MVTRDDPKPPGWNDPPLPIHPRNPGAKPAAFRQLGLRHIMISLVYFAILFWSLKRVMETNSGSVEVVIFGVMLGLGLCLIGLWAAFRLPRYAFVGWILFVVGYMTITASTTTFFAIPTLPILIGSIISLTQRRRSNDQEALLWVLAVASDRGMPLAPGVEAFASQSTGIYALWARSLAELLERGMALPEALESLPRLVTSRSLLLIRMGWESGKLAGGLREAVETGAARRSALRSIGGQASYLLWVMAFGSAIVAFVMYFVMPKFEAIYKDFGIELPPVTKLVIRASHAVVDFGGLLALGFLGSLIYLIVAYVGKGNLSVPIFDRLFARRHTILLLKVLAVVVDAGRPIAPALQSLARSYPTAWVRRKLKNASLETSQGIDWNLAMHENGLISESDLGVLASASRAGNLAWALRELAETGERRWAYRLQAWTQVLFVLTIIGLGGLVFVIAVAYFSPLTTLISRLAS